jgi:transcriptional regulator with XRE-family HTH domain
MDEQEVRSAIGLRLKESRLALGLSVRQVANRVGCKVLTVNRWEAGQSTPTVSDWYTIGKLYGVSLDYLVYGIRTVPVSVPSILEKILGTVGVEPTGSAFARPPTH